MEAVKSFPTKFVTFLKEVRLEMKKVNWPTRDQTIRFTLIVVVMSAVVSAYLGFLDFVLRKILERIII